VRGFTSGFISAVIALLLGIQFIRPARTNPPVNGARTLEKAVTVPPQVEKILARACQDCHSDLTDWPWYSKVAPISWYIVDHVNGGRRALNFSEFIGPNVTDAREYTLQKFHTVCREIRLGHMPLYSYVLLHREARLAPEAADAICDWAETGLSQRGSAR